jgi:hypothetical protein
VAREAAAEEHEASEAKFELLRNVLRSRARESYVWKEVWAARSFHPERFREPERSFSKSTIAAQAKAAHRVLPAVALLTASAAIATWAGLGYLSEPVVTLADGRLWIGAGALFALAGSIAAFARQRRKRSLAQHQLKQDLEAKHQESVSRARVDFTATENRRQEEWRANEQERERVRTAPEREDLEVLADVLEAELANETLPVPLVFEIEFESATTVRIELALPDLDDVPTELTSLTKTGKLSSKAISRRDRVGLYEDLCTGLALRVVYEIFRVLPTAQQIELFGTVDGIDPATGHSREFVTLRLLTTREVCGRLDLDHVDPSAAFEGLGGEFSLRRSGQLEPLPGIEGLEA